MMLADYFLTVYLAGLREKKYALHFRMRHYELNPVWQKAIAQKKWFNARHLVLTGIVFAFIVFISEFSTLPPAAVRGVIGAILATFVVVLARHVQNLCVFRHLMRNPDEVSGEVVLSHRFVLYLSLTQMLGLLAVMAFVTIFSRDESVLYAFLGILGLVIAHWRWLHKAGKQTTADAGE